MSKTRFGLYSLAVGAFALAITGCGGSKPESTENTAAPAAGAAAGKTVDPATAGEVTGSVKLDGAGPKPKIDQHGGRAGLCQGPH